MKDGLRASDLRVINLDASGQAIGGGLLLANTNIHYVDANKSPSVTGDGTTWVEAFLTITEAVSAAVAGDTILIAGTDNADSDSDPVNDYSESVTIPATKPGIRIIGTGNGPEGVKWTVGTAEGVILTINAIDCYVANIRFRPNGATSGSAIYVAKNTDLSACANGTIIENCIFRSRVETALAGIHTGGANDVQVLNCVFTSVATAVLQTTSNNAVTYRMIIKDNYVDDKCTNGVILEGRSCLIKNNDFAPGLTVIVQTDAVGAAGQENTVTGNTLICASAYETNCSGETTDNWMGNMCSDTASSAVGSPSPWTVDYPQA